MAGEKITNRIPSQSLENKGVKKGKIQELEEDNLALAPFTIKELRDAIPAHCFERSALRSGLYTVSDMIVVAAMMYISTLWSGYEMSNRIAGFVYSGADLLILNIISWMVAVVFWSVWWFWQGAFMTGLWVIAHECGHQSFSDSKLINNTVGFILHSALLVPYHSWRITHGMHHKNTAHMTRDQVFVPKVKSAVVESTSLHEAISDSPLVNIFQILLLFTVGWPFYIATNAWSQNYGRRANHFEPSAPMFKPSQKWDVIMSDIGMIMMIGVLIYAVNQYTFYTVVLTWGVPYLWVNFWLVGITYLQHTDQKVPHYRGEEWSFIRGALGTIDRDYGVLNHVLHHIGDTHVAHHLFSTMPHYHAEEATLHLRKVLGKYYMQDKTPIIKAFWKTWNECHYVDDEGSIVYYKKLNLNERKKN